MENDNILPGRSNEEIFDDSIRNLSPEDCALIRKDPRLLTEEEKQRFAIYEKLAMAREAFYKLDPLYNIE